MATPHHHAYLWLGHGDILVKPGDAHRRPGHPEFPSAPVMPLESADWLLKAPAHVRGTFARPRDAADWYVEEFTQHASALTGSYARAADPAQLIRRLEDRHDIVGGWWLTGGRFLSLNLIACAPHPLRPHHGCPSR
ncbi:hypothetical protein [Streptomyces sp. NPDC093109]|uniref:hypothetical protein n=1 Tax=Streptomyces sp. NPDC093109 TaxID=3154977 RepID=UPI00344E3F95